MEKDIESKQEDRIGIILPFQGDLTEEQRRLLGACLRWGRSDAHFVITGNQNIDNITSYIENKVKANWEYLHLTGSDGEIKEGVENMLAETAYDFFFPSKEETKRNTTIDKLALEVPVEVSQGATVWYDDVVLHRLAGKDWMFE